MNSEKKTENKKAAKGKTAKSAEATPTEAVVKAGQRKASNKNTAGTKASAIKETKKDNKVPVETTLPVVENEEEIQKLEKELAEIKALDIFRWQTLDYNLAVRIVKRDIGAMPYGTIRVFCATNKLTYHTVIGFLNDTLTFDAPRLVLDLLYALEYDVKLTIEITPTREGVRQYKEVYYFTLRKKGTSI